MAERIHPDKTLIPQEPMMKPMVSDLVVNEETTSFFFLPEIPQVRKTKKDSDYLCLKLQDKTGTIDGRLWDIPTSLNVQLLKKGTFVKVRGQVTEWNETKQLGISGIRIADEADNLNLGDFFERSPHDPEEMFGELNKLLSANMSGELLSLLNHIFVLNGDKLKIAPAAKSVHHAYIGGLLEHVLSMCRAALPICAHYKLNTNLVLAACVLHDIGKIHELSYPIGIDYTLEGTLLGHISIGMDMVAKAANDVGISHKVKISLLHLIASHHGLLEYGSPKVPLMREAIGFHLIDMMDAKLMICDKAIKEGINEQGMTNWVKELGGPLFVLNED